MEIGARVRRGPAAQPKFVSGSILRHILNMTGAGAVGLMAIFLGDLANILFLSWQHDETVVAAVGYAGSIVFLTISVGLGLSIAATSLVAPALGAARRMRARRLSLNAHALTLLLAGAISFCIWLAIPSLLTLLGADSVIITGTTTSGCVRATVLDAFSNNYRVALAEEGCFDRSQASHAINLCDMNAKYADVVKTAEVLEFFDTLPSGMFDLPKGASAAPPKPKLAANF